MNQKTTKMMGYVVTGLLSAWMIAGGIFQMMLPTDVMAFFEPLQVTNPGTIRFMGLMKFMGGIGLWVPRGRDWAEKGFTFLFCGAAATHIGIGQPQAVIIPMTGLALLGASIWCMRKAGMMATGNANLGRRAA